MKIAITLLTCGRLDYTKQTLDTLLEHNPRLRSDFILLHGDDYNGCVTDGNESLKMAAAAGFRTCVSPNRRTGVARMTEILFQHAQRAGADAVLNLQNDWECKRAIPIDDIELILSNNRFYNVRMYGALKSHHGRCGIHHGGRTPLRVVKWKPHEVPGFEYGEIHWGHPPSVTLIDDAVLLTKGADSESQSRMRSGAFTTYTARVVDNVFSHIGRERTNGFKS